MPISEAKMIMPTNIDPYQWIRRDKHRRLFREFRLLSESKWRDRFRLRMCSIEKYRYHFTIEAEISGTNMFCLAQIVFPGNYPEAAPKVFIDQSVMSGSELLMLQHRSDNCFFNPDGSLRLELPTGDAVSAALVLDRAEEWSVRYKRHLNLNHVEE